MKYVCIHGHFYQPPREDPYTEVISKQSSAYRFNDWNEVVSFQCYGPNAFSRLLNDKGKIINIVDNYQHISFNFGPTLLSWMRKHAHKVYNEVLEADKLSMQLFGGHGSAVAQVYNHIIMPFASRGDKEVQVKWGIRDFLFHYGRRPEGMWLAETAVDTETLEVLAENGIKFTILSPYQAKAIRENNEEHFRPITKETLDTHKPYYVVLPSGKKIAIFFYDGDLAQQLSFGDLLNNGDNFYQNLCQRFNFQSNDNEILNVALDGETFGHHHRYGDMALAYCLNKILKSDNIKLVNYAQYLDIVPPTTQAEIHERTAWSCAHGIERWNSNCGCKTGGDPSWTQEWRGPLRKALDTLNVHVDKVFNEMAGEYFEHPYRVLYEYINVILNRSKQYTFDFFSTYTDKPIHDADLTKLARLFEMKRNAQLMYTSCGWFFTELSGIETVQILMYADRVLQIYEMITNEKIAVKEFLITLRQAKSNIPEYKDGETIYKMWVRPKRQSLAQVAMIQAFHQSNKDSGLMDMSDRSSQVDAAHVKRYELGYQRILTGNYELSSKITFSKRYFYFTLFQLSRANYIGYYTTSTTQMENPLNDVDLNEAINLKNLPALLDSVRKKYKFSFSLTDLLEEDQLLVLDSVSSREKVIVAQQLEDIYLRNYPLFVQYKQANKKMPFFLYNISATHLIDKMKYYLHEENFSLNALVKTMEDIKQWDIDLSSDEEEIKLLLPYLIADLLKNVRENFTKDAPLAYETIKNIEQLVQLILPLKLQIDLWSSQNIFLDFLVEQKSDVVRLRTESPLLFQSMEHISSFLNIDLAYVLQR